MKRLLFYPLASLALIQFCISNKMIPQAESLRIVLSTMFYDRGIELSTAEKACPTYHDLFLHAVGFYS